MVLVSIASTCMWLGCGSRRQPFRSAELMQAMIAASQRPATPDPYAPELHAIELDPYIKREVTVFRFSEAQLARMAHTTLDPQRFVAYVEQKWPLTRLQQFCVASNRFPDGYQNLVAINCPISTNLHKDKPSGFDRIGVYVSEDNGPGTYIEGAGWNWHRWHYSLNIQRKKTHWVIIENLPNDFMDSAKYDTNGSANVLKAIHSETNQTPASAPAPN